MNDVIKNAIENGFSEFAEEVLMLEAVGFDAASISLRLCDIVFIAKVTGMSFKYAAKVCYDREPGFTNGLDRFSFEIGYEAARKLSEIRFTEAVRNPDCPIKINIVDKTPEAAAEAKGN